MLRTSDEVLDRELAIVATLRQAATVPSLGGPNPQERDRMRQRIMTEFPSVVHEGTSPVLPLREPRHRRRRSPQQHQARGRLVVSAAAALCLVMSLSGISLLLSSTALPGDPLYAFKRSAESAALGLTFGDENKALKHLEFAEARVSEIEAMVAQADAEGTWSVDDDRFIRALADFERDTTAGTRLLTEVISGDGSSAILLPLRGWVEQQESRLLAVRSALPLAASARLDSTLDLLNRVVTRVDALDRRSDCLTITLGTQDNLGLLPARGACNSALPSGESMALPLPAPEGIAEANSADSLVPPGLLDRPSGPTPITEPGQSGRLGLGEASDGMLPDRRQSDADSSHPALGDPSSSPPLLPMPIPLPGGIPLLPLLPMENPHVE